MKYLFVLVMSLCSQPLFAQHDHEITPTAEFRVTGAVKRELKFRIADVAGYKQEALGDVVIRNKRGEQKDIAKQLKGVLLKTVLDSAEILADKPKDYSELIIILTASDGYKNVYSWNELFNTEVGNHVYIVTEMDGKPMQQMPDRILILSLSDINSGRRHLKSLAKVEVKKVL